MSETNSEELQLFVGLLKTALVREHAVLPQFILATRICGAGNWTAAAELARSLTQLSEEFLESNRRIILINRSCVTIIHANKPVDAIEVGGKSPARPYLVQKGTLVSK